MDEPDTPSCHSSGPGRPGENSFYIYQIKTVKVPMQHKLAVKISETDPNLWNQD